MKTMKIAFLKAYAKKATKSIAESGKAIGMALKSVSERLK